MDLGDGLSGDVDSRTNQALCQVRWLLLANNGTNAVPVAELVKSWPIDLYGPRGSCRRRSTLGAGIGGIARVAERVLGRKLPTAINIVLCCIELSSVF